LAAIALADAGFLVALLRRRDTRHGWAKQEAARHAPPWHSCEAVLSEAFQLLGGYGIAELGELLDQNTIMMAFALAEHRRPVIQLMTKYRNLPMSVADACLVRMSEIVTDSIVLTTDSDFRVYRRHSRQIVPCAMPS
jgi:uncharacterized protein